MTPHLGSTPRADHIGRGAAEPGTWMVWGQESGSAPSLVCHGMARLKKICSPLNPLPPVTGRRAFKQKMWPCPCPSAVIQKVNPAPHLGKTGELAPVVWVWVIRPKAVRAGGLTPLLAVWYIGWATQSSTGELTWVVMMTESWQADQPSYSPSPKPGLRDSTP